MHRAVRIGLAVSALVLGPGFSLANTVWVVDSTGAGHYTQIQPAIDAAADGDTVLVKTGSYSGFAIDNKMLSVVGDSGATVQVTGQIVVQNLAAGKFAVLGGFNARATSTATLWLKDNPGSVRVQSVVLEGVYPGTAVITTQAALVEFSADVFFTTVSLLGTNGPDGYPSGPGGHGLRQVGSSVSLYSCTLRGGRGGQGTGGPWPDGGAGGHGGLVFGGFLFASSTTFEGGRGGDSGQNGDCLQGWGTGGDGGHGIAVSSAQGELQGSTAQGGLPGQGAGTSGCGCGCWDGSPGDPIDNPGLVHTIAGQPRLLTAPLVAREASTVPFDFEGVIGDQVHLYLARQTVFQFSPARKGVFILPPSSPFRFMGQLDSLGLLSHGFEFPDLGGSAESRVYFLQSVHRAGAADRTLGTGRCLVVLDRTL